MQQSANRDDKLAAAEKEFMHKTPIQIGSNAENAQRFKQNVDTLDHSKVAEHPREFIDDLIANHRLCLFSRSNARSASMKRLLTEMDAEFQTVDIDYRGDTETLERILFEKTGGKNLPLLFMGGMPFEWSEVKAAHDDKSLEQRIRNAGGFERKDRTTPSLRVPNRVNEDFTA